MHPVSKNYIYNEDSERFFGTGPCRLLRGVQRTGSLNAAATEMEMAYTKALAIIKMLEKTLGTKVICRKIGGKGGGGSQLTPIAKELIERYEQYETACAQQNSKLFEMYFQGFGQTPPTDNREP